MSNSLRCGRPFVYAKTLELSAPSLTSAKLDVAWRDGALLKLYRAGIPIHLWHLVDDLVSDRTAAVRIGSCASDSWDVESGVGQGAVLSGFLFNLLINGLAAAIKRACRGVSCGPDRGAPRLQVLLYADDIVILSDSPADLQRGLDAARDWANAWRFHFSIGPNKSAIAVFGRSRAGTQHVLFHVGEHVLPHVSTYTYVGITLHERLGWTQHIDELSCRGERKLSNSQVSNSRVNKMGPTFAYLATWQPSCRCPGPTWLA